LWCLPQQGHALMQPVLLLVLLMVLLLILLLVLHCRC
jgi:hypothetical protein